jgi:ribonucleoside-triphosphate reductase (thioredoxin)
MNKYFLDTRAPKRFKISEQFLDKYLRNTYKDGCPPLSELATLVFKRTYARPVLNSETRLESWNECCKRVVEGVFNIQKRHCKDLRLPWDDRKAQRTAQDMFSRMYEMKWTPPGRGLWAMGTQIVDKKGSAALNNCGACSTKDLATDFSGPFCFLMDMSMLGVGIGADTKGAGKVFVQEPIVDLSSVFTIADSREGWVDSVRILLDAYVGKGHIPTFDYSHIRKKGEPLKNFGGKASGPAPLKELLGEIELILNKRVGEKIDSTSIVDLFNVIGRCVVAGGIRRSAEIMIGEVDDKVFPTLKNRSRLNELYEEQANLRSGIEEGYSVLFCEASSEDDFVERNKIFDNLISDLVSNIELTHDKIKPLVRDYIRVTKVINEDPVNKYRWASNNSIFAHQGMDYSKYVDQIANSGEPGFVWLENMRKYGRLLDDPNWKDIRVVATNPCGEQSLEDRELCCLVETFPANHTDVHDYLKTLKVAYLYAKTVTLVPTHDERTNAVLMRNRRIGCSMSGIVQAIEKFGRADFRGMCLQGYDKIQELDECYSEWLCVPRSRKTTSVKPSGTVSLLAGSTPGIHYDHAPFYIRNIRIRTDSPLVKACSAAGYKVEKDLFAPDTMVISFPVQAENFSKSKADVSIWEQFANAAFMQKYWSDNQVSITISFSEEEKKDIVSCLEHYEDQLKSVSLLPRGNKIYPQAPYIEISKEDYCNYASTLKKINFNHAIHEETEKFCDGDSCSL